MKKNKVLIYSTIVIYFLSAVFFALNALFIICKNSGAHIKEDITTQYESFYVNAPDMSEEELFAYYEENGINPMSSDDKYDYAYYQYRSLESNIGERLQDSFPNYTWNSNYTDKVSIKDKYGANPLNVNDEMSWLERAITDSNLPSQKENVGCGAIAMMSALNFLSETMEYYSLRKHPSNNIDNSYIESNRYEIAMNVIAETPSTGWWGAGTSIMPSSFIIGARNVLSNHNLWSSSGEIVKVYGDLVSRNETVDEKISTIKSAIDRGAQIILWTGVDFEGYSNHYMNIIGYEDWNGIDADGNEVAHTFIMLNMNWTSTSIQYVDSSLFNALTMGFIFIEPNYKNIQFNHSFIGVEERYNSLECQTPTLVHGATGYNGYARYLRMALISHYADSAGTVRDGKYLAISPKRKGAGEAYLEFSVFAYVKKIHLDVSWWRTKDRYTSINGQLKLQVLNIDENVWYDVFDFLDVNNNISTDLNNPSKVIISVNNPASFVFRIYAKYDNPTNESNGGRFVIHGVNVFCE